MYRTSSIYAVLSIILTTERFYERKWGQACISLNKMPWHFMADRDLCLRIFQRKLAQSSAVQQVATKFITYHYKLQHFRHLDTCRETDHVGTPSSGCCFPIGPITPRDSNPASWLADFWHVPLTMEFYWLSNCTSIYKVSALSYLETWAEWRVAVCLHCIVILLYCI